MKQVDQTEFAEETVAELRARVEELEALFQRMLAVHWGWVALEAQQRKRIEEMETAILRHVEARDGESGERPDITVARLYRLVKHLPPRTSNNTEKAK